MKNKIYLFGLLAMMSLSARASLYQFGTLAGGSAIGTIADNSTIGLSSSYTVSGEGASLSDLTLTFVLQGGASTDLSGYLRLGNSTGSPYYDLSTLIHSETLSAGSATTYTISFSDSSFQSTFTGLNPNDTWTLYFADGVPGDQTTFNGWSLGITAVPEPVNIGLCLFGGIVGLVWLKRRFQTERRAV